MSLRVDQELNTTKGVYIELECSIDTKKKIQQYIHENIDKNSKFDDFHVTLIYSSKPFNGKLNIDLNIDKLYASVDTFVRFDNPSEDVYAVAFKLRCLSCIDLHNSLMKQYKFKYDFDEYIPHLTLTYKGENIDISKLPKPKFILKFDRINVEPLKTNWQEDVE